MVNWKDIKDMTDTFIKDQLEQCYMIDHLMNICAIYQQRKKDTYNSFIIHISKTHGWELFSHSKNVECASVLIITCIKDQLRQCYMIDNLIKIFAINQTRDKDRPVETFACIVKSYVFEIKFTEYHDAGQRQSDTGEGGREGGKRKPAD